MGKILVVEDNDVLRSSVVQALVENGHNVSEVGDGEEATERLQEESYDVVLTDMRMPRKSGLEVLRFAKQVNDLTVAIVMTAFGTIESAVEAMKSGAYDYIQKPFELEELEVKINRALEHRRDSGVLQLLRSQSSVALEHNNIVGNSPQIRKIFEIIKKIARSNASILITGETGTGKELIASLAHYNSLRAKQSFVKVNCAALQENLLESELFGHEKGAFTSADRQRIGRFEQANGGTLFLDEIGDMSASTQAKVLRVLQEQEFERLGGMKTIKVDVRIIAATNKNLKDAIANSTFREDLYYRLNTVGIETPALRERKEDVLPLANFFAKKYSEELKKTITGFSPQAVKYLTRHNWPGNIRELQNTIERAVLMAESNLIGVEDLSLNSSKGDASSIDALGIKIPPCGIKLEDLERNTIIEALKMTNWVQKDAAELLGVSRRVLNYKVKIHNINHDRWRRKPQNN
ncbi:MAG: sigma-54 dependent transcriptional regulator [Acidobacteria bacterium]|nr:sigma-54 dependent transcriptional regulator [Acidobacteriota bacterium]MCI0724203.1 sigma-54 dependent transcriptional regulator [Acidobacteriota bacterium]